MKTMPQELINMAKKDLKRIDDALSCPSNEQRWELFRELDGRYQVCIQKWYLGMLQAAPDGQSLRYARLSDRPSDVLDNLKIAKAKLEVFLLGVNAVNETEHSDTEIHVTTNVNVGVTFEQVRSQIEDMTALSREQTDEILEKINELEEISKEKTSRKIKWEKIKPIIAFALDKGADVAIAILSLVMQMKLGM